MSMRDGVCGAGFYAISAEDATVVIDVIDLGIAFSTRDTVFLRVLSSFDIDAIRRTRRRAQEARNAFFQSILVALQHMQTAESFLEDCAAHGPFAVGVILHHMWLEHFHECDGHPFGDRPNAFKNVHGNSISQLLFSSIWASSSQHPSELRGFYFSSTGMTIVTYSYIVHNLQSVYSETGVLPLMKGNLQRTLLLTFVSALLVLAAVTFLSYRNMQAVRESNRWVTHSQESITALNNILASVKDIEVGQQGFLVTGDQNYLNSYEEGISEQTLEYEKLAKLVGQHPEQQRDFLLLHHALEDYVNFTRQLIAKNNKVGPVGQSSVSTSNSQEVKLTTQIHNIAKEMLDVEHDELNKHSLEATNQLQSTQSTIFLLCFISLAMVFGSFVFVRRDTKRREAAERATQEANEQLNLWVEELEKRNNEVGFLNEVIEVLQMCAQPSDAYSAIEKSMMRMYPTAAGALYLFNNSRNLLEEVARWNGHEGEQVFTPEDCCALRSGHAHLVREPNAALLCRHLAGEPTGPTKCIPLTAHGEVLGLMHLYMGAMTPFEIEQDFRTSRRSFLASVVDHFAMSLANLKLRETLRAQSIRDPLTGLFNRRHMEVSLEREIRRATRKTTSVGVLVADLDHFKNFNDTFGHDAGDALLRETGHVLGSTVRAEDIVCRFGGEEFVLILPDVTPVIAVARAESLRQAIRSLNITHGGQTLGRVTLSIGVALFPEHGRESASVVKSADKALFLAKSTGRDRVVLSDASVVALDS